MAVDHGHGEGYRDGHAPRHHVRQPFPYTVPPSATARLPAGATTESPGALRERPAPAQMASAAVGILFVVTGAVGLARGGVDSLGSPTTEVAGMGMTPGLALVHLAVGVSTLFGATSRSAGRGAALLAGPALVASGVILLIEPLPGLGADAANGAAYLVIGALACIAAGCTPGRGRRRQGDRAAPYH